jgi:predicted transposase/invertase (TIGR01784 family)
MVLDMYIMDEDYADYLRDLGMKKGLRKGIKKGTLQVVKKMLANGVTPSFISKNTGIPLVEVKKIKDKVL